MLTNEYETIGLTGTYNAYLKTPENIKIWNLLFRGFKTLKKKFYRKAASVEYTKLHQWLHPKNIEYFEYLPIQETF